jgi:hypothetical protein
MRKVALGVAAVMVVAVSVGLSSAAAVTSKPLVAVQVDEFSVFPGTQGAPQGKVRFGNCTAERAQNRLSQRAGMA